MSPLDPLDSPPSELDVLDVPALPEPEPESALLPTEPSPVPPPPSPPPVQPAIDVTNSSATIARIHASRVRIHHPPTMPL
ncbi:MAG: hypothetical protein U0168_03275 [Nannocystaceae bacterium]